MPLPARGPSHSLAVSAEDSEAHSGGHLAGPLKSVDSKAGNPRWRKSLGASLLPWYGHVAFNVLGGRGRWFWATQLTEPVSNRISSSDRTK
jgi:hypothetical protein